jgi:SAM-dependent methyltransferase
MTPAFEYDKKHPRWKDWYPPVNPRFEEIPLGESVYGPPNEKTLALFKALSRRSSIWDMGGGDGRYALPLARMGHNVFVSDVDERHLQRLFRNASVLPPEAGRIVPVIADATQPSPMRDNSVDAAVNMGFGYLIPPAKLDAVFGSMARALKPNGLLVFEFATDRVRKDGSGNSLIGAKEYNYTRKEGLETLQRLGLKYGIEFNPPIEDHYHSEVHYLLKYDLIIANGRKK